MSSPESETRKRILAVTMRLMEQGKGQEVRLSDIARAAGVSRQAIYLHFSSRADLLVATVRYVDEINGVEHKVQGICASANGQEALAAMVDFWGNYIPVIYGLAKALLAAREADPAAAAAWEDRMAVLRAGCRQVIESLQRQKVLRADWNINEAAALFWAMLSISIWENLTVDCGWSKAQYIRSIQTSAKLTFVRQT